MRLKSTFGRVAVIAYALLFLFGSTAVATAAKGRELHVSSPMFPKARIAGRNITILAPGAPDVYVRNVRWNGRVVDQPWLPEQFVQRGGVLRVDLSQCPD